jgi:hypothetical protein
MTKFRHTKREIGYYCDNAIIAALALFTLNVGYEKFKDIDSISVTESQSKACIIDFRKNSCNPLNLTGPCKKILTAYKRTEDNHGQPRPCPS